MALKQLMIRKKIESKRSELGALTPEIEALETRSAEAKAAIEEAQTDEEMKAVELEVEEIEVVRSDVDGKKKTLEEEIAVLEGELEQLNSNAPGDAQPAERSKSEPNKVRTIGVGGEGSMKRGLFNEWPFEERSALVQRNEVKEFLDQVRSLRTVSQKRAVTGADLTIPEVMLGIIRDNLYKYSKLISKVNKKPLTGKGRQNIAGNVPEGIWTEAVGSLNELEMLFKQVEVDEYKVGGFIAINNNTLEDSDLNLAAEILEALSQAIGLGVDKAIVYGTGKKMPLGIVTRLAQAAEPSDWSSKAPTWANLSVLNLLKVDPTQAAQAFYSDLVLKLGVAKPNYATGETVWVMNRNTKLSLMSKAITFNAAGALVAGSMGRMPVENGEIIVLPFLPDGDIVGGYLSNYLLGERKEVQLAQSEHVRFLDDQTVYKGTARYDGLPVFGESFVVVNIKNVAPTTEVTFAPDQSNPTDAYLAALSIGSIDLSPTFAGAVDTYTAATTNATNTISATPFVTKATVAIDVDGTPVVSGASATWAEGENVVTITVTNGTTVKSYTVTVTKS
jgi:HK97 family phage major capsid protein